MPSFFASPLDDEEVGEDEFGDPFAVEGFLQRAEDYKNKGNDEFQKERYERSLRDYNNALDCLITITHDRSAVLGKKTINDAVVLRSTLHMNRSTCYFKMKKYSMSLEEAMQCLTQNSAQSVESKLPKIMRAKAWYRISQCSAYMESLDDAREALAKAMELADDDKFVAELSKHSLKIGVIGKEQRDKQRTIFRGFWDKLQDRGGYADKKMNLRPKWDTLNYAQKYDDVAEEAEEEMAEGAPFEYQEPPVSQAERQGMVNRFVRKMPRGTGPDKLMKAYERQKSKQIDASFEDYLARKPDIEAAADEGPELPRVDAAGRPLKPGEEPEPVKDPFDKRRRSRRPKKKDQSENIKYVPPTRYRPRRARVSVLPSGGDFAQLLASKQKESEEKESEWRAQMEVEKLNRERAKFEREQQAVTKRAQLEMLDDSDGD